LSAALEREWRRFTPAERIGRFVVYFCVVAAVVASLRTVEVIPEFLYDAPEQIGDMLRRMWPVAWQHYPEGVHAPLVDSLHIATLGTVLAVLMAVPVAFLAAKNVTPQPALNYLAKLVLVAARSVNTLIWALFFVAVFGPGSLAGTLAIAFHSIGFTGKLLGEALEESNRGTIEALDINTKVHMVADEDHSDMFEPIFDKYVVDERTAQAVIRAAQDSLAIDRAYRSALATAMSEISEKAA